MVGHSTENLNLLESHAALGRSATQVIGRTLIMSFQILAYVEVVN